MRRAEPWGARTWFERLRHERARGTPHSGPDGIPHGSSRFPSADQLCDRCFLVKIAHMMDVWDSLLELAEGAQAEEMVHDETLVEPQQSEVISYSGCVVNAAGPSPAAASTTARLTTAISPLAPTPSRRGKLEWAVGAWVCHRRFGAGKVVTVSTTPAAESSRQITPSRTRAQRVLTRTVQFGSLGRLYWFPESDGKFSAPPCPSGNSSVAYSKSICAALAADRSAGITVA